MVIPGLTFKKSGESNIIIKNNGGRLTIETPILECISISDENIKLEIASELCEESDKFLNFMNELFKQSETECRKYKNDIYIMNWLKEGNIKLKLKYQRNNLITIIQSENKKDPSIPYYMSLKRLKNSIEQNRVLGIKCKIEIPNIWLTTSYNDTEKWLGGLNMYITEMMVIED